MRIHIALLCLLFIAFAACGEEQFAPRGKTRKEQKPTGITGLLLNAQQAEKNVDAAERKVTGWEIADDSGVTIISSEDIDPQFKQLKGVKYEWKRALALEGSSNWLGKNHREIRIRETKITGEGKEKKATYVVSAGEAAELRSLPNLGEIIRQANIVILLGKIGD
jgi:hypothetical protein